MLGGERELRVARGTKGTGVKTTENNIASLIGAGRMTMVKKGKQGRKEESEEPGSGGAQWSSTGRQRVSGEARR